MTYKIRLPDNTYLQLPDTLSPNEGIDKAVDAFPQLFYVDAAYKCGDKVEFAPVLMDSGYACGHIAATKKSIALRDDVGIFGNAFSTEASLVSASLAAIFALACFFILFKLFVNFSYKESRLKYSYVLLLLASICFGVQSIANQLFLSNYTQVAINMNSIWSSFLGLIIGFPVILTVTYFLLIFIHQFKSKHKEVDSDYFLQAMNELNTEGRNDALWAKCFAESAGDESKTKALYIKNRAADLSKIN